MAAIMMYIYEHHIYEQHKKFVLNLRQCGSKAQSRRTHIWREHFDRSTFLRYLEESLWLEAKGQKPWAND